MSRLVLGLANLNSKYGKLKNSLSAKEFKGILSEKKNTLVDTAILYRKNINILKKEKEKITIISKLPKINLKKISKTKFILQFQIILKNLG